MSAREQAVIKARRIARKQLATIAEEIRDARLKSGRSQQDVAKAAGVSSSKLSRIELGAPLGMRLEDVAAACAAVGLAASLKTYPGDHILADAAQVRLLRVLRERLGPEWRWRFEVRVAAGDPRAWDMRGRHAVTGLVVVVEAETRVRDLQAVLRRISGKREAAMAPRTILLLADTRNNRAVVSHCRDELAAEFPVGTWRSVRLLKEGRDPGQDCLLVLRGHSDDQGDTGRQ